ncbi:helix-turn-helix domain-containing protein [Cellulosilyticum sp. I15G10I2]|uniref:helix-turn-helix domain-containing protein n=1 Tax=Cellulosilyticum sp. I15G10I2 TaxID=1892843 RepID=UPI00085CB9E8|nr:helix-turn-helix domain-containing protein [Cellulosilyticum sp. I15G10I2]
MLREGDYLTVKDVSDMLDTEAYVLRFYEKELNLNIKRNAKGHRVYTMEDVELFKQIQDMREQGLQLKAIEGIVHDSNQEAKETYEQLSSIQMATITPIKKNDISTLDITDEDQDKVKQFSVMMKEMFKQALVEYNDHSKEEMKQEIQEEVNSAVDKKLTQLEEKQNEKNEEYYRKLDETMREVQKIRREIAQGNFENAKNKSSFWSRIFKEKDRATDI